jgi:hypothetical protein
MERPINLWEKRKIDVLLLKVWIGEHMVEDFSKNSNEK